MPFRDESVEWRNGFLGIPASGGDDGRNGARGGGNIHPPLSEHHISLHCDPANTGSVSSGVEEAGSMGDTTLVVTVGS